MSSLTVVRKMTVNAKLKCVNGASRHVRANPDIVERTSRMSTVLSHKSVLTGLADHLAVILRFYVLHLKEGCSYVAESGGCFLKIIVDLSGISERSVHFGMAACIEEVFASASQAACSDLPGQNEPIVIRSSGNSFGVFN